MRTDLGMIIFGAALLLIGVAITPIQPLSSYMFWIGAVLLVLGIILAVASVSNG